MWPMENLFIRLSPRRLRMRINALYGAREKGRIGLF